MRWQRWAAAWLAALWLLVPALSAVAMEGPRARLAPVEAPEGSDEDESGDVFSAFRVAQKAVDSGLDVVDDALEDVKSPGKLTVFSFVWEMAEFCANGALLGLPDDARNWAEIVGDAGDGLFTLIEHFRAAGTEGSKVAVQLNRWKGLGPISSVLGALKMGWENKGRFDEFARTFTPKNVKAALLQVGSDGNWAKVAGRWVGVIGLGLTALQGTLTLVGAIRDRNGDKTERFIRGLGGTLMIAGAAVGLAALLAPAAAVAAGAVMTSTLLILAGQVLSNKNVAAKVASGLRTAANWVATGARNLGNKAANAARNLSNRAAGAVRSLSTAAVSTARNLRDKAASTARNLGSKAYGTLRNAASQVNNAGQAIKQGLGNLVNRFRGKKEEQQPSTQSGSSLAQAAATATQTRNRENRR